jgi:cation diffusion facilitator CzcD-associated flavoprotein CzcO
VRRFKGKQVLVVGAGQSALESAALIHEAGGNVEVIVRAPSVHWLGWRSKLQKLGPLGKMLYSPADVGPAGVSRIVAFPNSVKYFPRWMQDRFRTRSLRPAGARWLMERCSSIPMTPARFIESAKMQGDKVNVRLNDGSTRSVDHVLQGTGYKIEVSRYPFLAPKLAEEIAQVNGFPKMKQGFECSVPGLHILGAPAAWTFGPLLFFVAGTDFAARNLARKISAEMKS